MTGSSAENRVPLSAEWIGGIDGCLRLLDQTLLPSEVKFLDCRDIETVWEAIKSLRVRGAPAIGVTAAFGIVIGVRSAANDSPEAFRAKLRQAADYLRTSRPTAVNLFWAISRMEECADRLASESPSRIVACLLNEAEKIRQEDRLMCLEIGKHGAELFQHGWGVLTHCNTGGLATAEYGTAFSTLLHAHKAGKNITVYADETRPLLQGSRLTMWELMQHQIPAVLLCDNMAGSIMRTGKIQAAIVGADRIAANGDTANKIGTYSVAVLCKAHSIPFYVAAPTTTLDMNCPDGSAIPIEQRADFEVTHVLGTSIAPTGVQVYNPAFDVTPANLIAGIVTEKGVIRPPFRERLAELMRPSLEGIPLA